MRALSSISLGLRRHIVAISAILLMLAGTGNAVMGQDVPPPPTPSDNIRFGYIVHQSVDLGGHIADISGNTAVYNTMVNIRSGPRILDQSLDMRAVDPTHATVFDHLFTSSFGYGGDPNNVTLLNISKGKLYDFRGSFRRNRQYFDYNLLANPLIPPASTPFIPILSTTHLYNTVRRMTDLNLTVAPLSRVSGRVGYSHFVNEGPSTSTIHVGAEALLDQFWRNSTDNWTGGLDWRPAQNTTLSYDQFVTHYKGDTYWQLTGLNYQLPNGTPVSLGVNISSVWGTPCAKPFNADGTVSPTCNAFLAYNRSSPTRTLIPTEQFRFQTGPIPQITMNGRVLYSSATSNLRNFYELFNGLSSRAALRQSIVTGSARVRRINLSADYGLTWQITPTVSISDVFNFWHFRMPGNNTLTETDYAGTTMLAPPGATTATTTTDNQALNQKSTTNTFVVAWDVRPETRVTLGYRYRDRVITDLGGDLIPIHEHWGVFGTVLKPTPQWRINFNVDAMYADNAFTRVSPRQLQRYLVRSTYRPRPWLTFAGTANIREARNNVDTVNHLEHNRNFSFGASISRSERWSLDLSYAYDSIFSSTTLCYPSTPPPPTAVTAPAVCVAAGTPYRSTGYYNAPIQFGTVGFVMAPAKRVHLDAGYRTTAVNGTTDLINIRQVPGPLQSWFQTPYANVTVEIAPNWSWKANYNYYGYGEGTPVGPTLPRNFRGNVFTLAVHYAF